MANGNGLTKAERELEKVEDRQDRARAKERAKKLQVKELLGSLVIGLGIGAIKVRMPSLLEGFGPGGYLKLDHVLALGGTWLAFNGKNGSREYGTAAAVIGLSRLAEPYGERLGSGFGA